MFHANFVWLIDTRLSWNLKKKDTILPLLKGDCCFSPILAETKCGGGRQSRRFQRLFCLASNPEISISGSLQTKKVPTTFAFRPQWAREPIIGCVNLHGCFLLNKRDLISVGIKQNVLDFGRKSLIQCYLEKTTVPRPLINSENQLLS